MGFVTAEVAIVLPALLLVLAAVMALTHAAAVQMVVQDAAAMGARAAARGEADAVVRQQVERVAPADATVSVARAGGLVRVSVSALASAGGSAARLLPSFEVSAEAVAADEQVSGAVP